MQSARLLPWCTDRFDMEKIILFNVPPETAALIVRAAGNMRIKVRTAAPESCMETLDRLANGAGTPDRPESGAAAGTPDRTESGAAAGAGTPDRPESGAAKAKTPDRTPSESLLLMCNLTDKHMDRLLAQLRQAPKPVDYKAALTPINKGWTLKRLLLELEREKKALGAFTE